MAPCRSRKRQRRSSSGSDTSQFSELGFAADESSAQAPGTPAAEGGEQSTNTTSTGASHELYPIVEEDVFDELTCNNFLEYARRHPITLDDQLEVVAAMFSYAAFQNDESDDVSAEDVKGSAWRVPRYKIHDFFAPFITSEAVSTELKALNDKVAKLQLATSASAGSKLARFNKESVKRATRQYILAPNTAGYSRASDSIHKATMAYLRQHPEAIDDKDGKRYFEVAHLSDLNEVSRFVRTYIETWRGNMKNTLNKSLGREGEPEPWPFATFVKVICGTDVTPTKARMIRFATWRHYAKELDVKFEVQDEKTGDISWKSNQYFWEKYDRKLGKLNAALLSNDAQKKQQANARFLAIFDHEVKQDQETLELIRDPTDADAEIEARFMAGA